jgi:hypothetical protein
MEWMDGFSLADIAAAVPSDTHLPTSFVFTQLYSPHYVAITLPRFRCKQSRALAFAVSLYCKIVKRSTPPPPPPPLIPSVPRSVFTFALASAALALYSRHRAIALHSSS